MTTTLERVSAPIEDVEAEIERLATRNQAARAWAITSLGSRWVLHPAYEKPRHHLAGHRSSAALAPVMVAATAAGRI